MQQTIAFLSAKDETLKYILDHFGLPVIQKRQEGFAALVHIILEQQVSIASAKACYQKIEKYFEQITPEIIFNCTDTELRNCGVSRQKTLYLKDLAVKVLSNEIQFESYASKNEALIRNELLAIKGVGHWSIDVYLMFCLQLPDIIPLGDIAIRNTLKELYNCQSLQEMEIVSNQWKPYRTLASFIIWHYYLNKKAKRKPVM